MNVPPLLMTILSIAFGGAVCVVFWRKSGRMDYAQRIENERS